MYNYEVHTNRCTSDTTRFISSRAGIRTGAYTCQAGLSAKEQESKKAGWIMLGAGTLMAVVGGVTFNNTYDSDSYASTDIGGGLLLGGIVVDLASIPFFISSAKNARKAAGISFHYQNWPGICGHSIVSKTYPDTFNIFILNTFNQ